MSHEMAIEVIQNAEIQLRSFQEKGLKLVEAEKILNKAKKELEANSITNAISLINELGTKLEHIRKEWQDYSDISSECYNNLQQAKALKLDISDQEEMFSEAEDLFWAEKFEPGLKILKKCKIQINDILYLFVTGEIKVIYNQFKQLPANVIQSYDIRRMFNEVDSAVGINNYQAAWSITLQLKTIYDNLSQPILGQLREQAKDKVIEFQNDLEKADKLGVDLTDAKEIFSKLVEQMRKASELSEFKEVIDYTAAGRRALERALRRKQRNEGQETNVKELLNKVILEINDLRTHFAIPGSFKNLINDAKSALAEGNLDITVEKVNICAEKINKLRQNSEPKLIVQFEAGTLQPNLWNRTQITISNRGLANASDIHIKLTGPVEVRRMSDLKQLTYNTDQTFEIGLRVVGAGAVPIDIDLTYKRAYDDKPYKEHQELWVDIIESTQQYPEVSATTAPSHTTTSESYTIVSCVYCKNKITKSAPIFKCSCGSIYHLECITGLDKCLKCNSKISGQVGVVPRKD